MYASASVERTSGSGVWRGRPVTATWSAIDLRLLNMSEDRAVRNFEKESAVCVGCKRVAWSSYDDLSLVELTDQRQLGTFLTNAFIYSMVWYHYIVQCFPKPFVAMLSPLFKTANCPIGRLSHIIMHYTVVAEHSCSDYAISNRKIVDRPEMGIEVRTVWRKCPTEVRRDRLRKPA
jgi:hypothetical protein